MAKSKQQLGASAEAIQYHYDLSNEFYMAWLDPLMVYSCGKWEKADNLLQSQLDKMDYHIAQAEAASKDRVLDIGCGWGALMRRLIETHQVKEVVGLTLSKKQQEFCQERYPFQNLSVALESWEAHQANTPYDAIISIGAFEHFAKQGLTEAARIAGYRAFFKKCHELLKDGGCLSLQTIGCGNMIREDFSAFFATEIFPESDLPRLSEIMVASEFLFEVKTVLNDRLDYAKTLKEWKKNFRKNYDLLSKFTTKEVMDRYEKYFALAIISFESMATMNLYRISFQRIDQPRILP